jgi:hydrogenase/urease accessory protein HupE
VVVAVLPVLPAPLRKELSMMPSLSVISFFRLALLLLFLTPFPALAHEGHVLDLVSAFMQPLAGWDHLLMALMFLGVLAVGFRLTLKALGRQRRNEPKDQP